MFDAWAWTVYNPMSYLTHLTGFCVRCPIVHALQLTPDEVATELKKFDDQPLVFMAHPVVLDMAGGPPGRCVRGNVKGRCKITIAMASCLSTQILHRKPESWRHVALYLEILHGPMLMMGWRHATCSH